MQVEPHENLTVWSIRYDRFGPGRFHPATPRYYRCADRPQVSRPDCNHSDRARACDTHHRRIERRVVEHPHRPQPADCRPCQGDRSALPSVFPRWLLYMPMIQFAWPYNAALPALPAPTPPIPVQDFAYGQPVPPLGSLLDILA